MTSFTGAPANRVDDDNLSFNNHSSKQMEYFLAALNHNVCGWFQAEKLGCWTHLP